MSISTLVMSASNGLYGIGQQEYTTPGTYYWTCPQDVEFVSVVCVGGGGRAYYLNQPNRWLGGGGGGLGWKNGIKVTPNQTYLVKVGGQYEDSYFISTDIVAGLTGGFSGEGGLYVGDGGGNGGEGRFEVNPGGGGAGGYSGNGGDGILDGEGEVVYAPTAGTGGAGGGGGYSTRGGGVGIYGEGASGAAYGGGGSGGQNGSAGGLFGGGGSGSGTTMINAGTGAVRIIWGNGRAFPSCNTQNI